MMQLFILVTAVLLTAGCAGIRDDTRGLAGSAESATSFNPQSNTYFGG